MRRLVVAIVVVTALGAARAEAITVRELIELSKTGLSDEVLLALIEIESKVFPVDPDTVKALKDAGVSQRVIAAMVRHGRSKPFEPAPAAPFDTPAPAPAPQPQVVVIDHHDQEVAAVREVPVAVPVYVPIYVRPSRHRDGGGTTYVPADVLAPSIGLSHGRFGLSAAPPKPTSDPPYWQQVVPLPRRSDPPGWQKSPYLKP
jgi:hypothetical protein